MSDNNDPRMKTEATSANSDGDIFGFHLCPAQPSQPPQFQLSRDNYSTQRCKDIYMASLGDALKIIGHRLSSLLSGESGGGTSYQDHLLFISNSCFIHSQDSGYCQDQWHLSFPLLSILHKCHSVPAGVSCELDSGVCWSARIQPGAKFSALT